MGKTMRAAIIRKWGEITVEDMPMPQPGADEVLVRLTYCGVCGSDIHIYNGEHPTAKPPVPMGHEMIGIVEKINSDRVLPFCVGDRVTIHDDSCGRCDLCLQGCANECTNKRVSKVSAGYAQYMKGHVDNVIPIPTHLSDKVAALIEPFSVGIRTTDRAGIRTADTVLISGGGIIGQVCAFVAREKGAARVIISEIDPARIATAKLYGFETINPRKKDVTEEIMKLTYGHGADVIIETSCSNAGIAMTPYAASVEGRIVLLAVGLPIKPFDVGLIALKELTIIGSRAHTAADMRRAARFLDGFGKKFDLDPLISDVLPLEEVRDAFEMMIEHKNKGKILIRCVE